ncbi:glycosyl hydrolase family 18 protein [uncultured Hymenobacter sp.]|uniref:glycosyl hydrolase family 18 protein n=1 Tax=uncultured Hymenobacter sp. TaxID=170016 RepID=UPI0035CC30E7
MKKITLLSRALGLLLLLTAAPAFAQFKVVGYLPSWNGEVSGVQFSKLTHVNYAFLLPNGDGSLKPIENPAKLQSLVSTAHANNVKVIISVGGWLDGNPGVFVSIANNAGYTSAFATNLINFVNQYNLDGVDIDWEHPDANTANGYASVMQSLATQLHGRGKLLTTAVAGGTWAGGYIQNSVLSNVDFLNIMAYDDSPPNHSTYALASQSVSYWRGRGLAASKTVLGVPFYGQPNGVPFATLLAQGADPNADLFNGVGYNGIATIKSKTNLAFDQGGGIMIWHLGQDVVGANSLLTAINQVVASRGTITPPATSGVATMYRDCNYTGTAVTLPVGDYSLAALQARGILNDDVSSLRVNSGYQVVLYENDNFGGAALTLASSNGCLVNNVLGTGNWNDKATSLRVQTAAAPSFSRQLEAEGANTNSGMIVESCTDTGGGQNLGYIDANDYLVFTNINFPVTGTYLIEYRVASGANGGTISADLNAGAIQLGSTSVPATGGWQNWQTVSKTVTINAGTYNFGVFAQTGGYNLNWVRISRSTSARGALVTAPTPRQASNGRTLDVYPNPATDQLSLSSGLELAGSQYRILNATGQRVASGSAARGTVSVAALPAGVYTLVVVTKDQQTITRRFVK